jgi:hypothetical protein
MVFLVKHLEELGKDLGRWRKYMPETLFRSYIAGTVYTVNLTPTSTVRNTGRMR